jgi:hypothetical protein
MYGAELLTQYSIAERQREARQAGLARQAAARREEHRHGKGSRRSGEPLATGRRPRLRFPFDDKSWMPRLRGYPVDPEFLRR